MRCSPCSFQCEKDVLWTALLLAASDDFEFIRGSTTTAMIGDSLLFCGEDTSVPGMFLEFVCRDLGFWIVRVSLLLLVDLACWGNGWLGRGGLGIVFLFFVFKEISTNNRYNDFTVNKNHDF